MNSKLYSPQISIIVPIYNASKVLVRCLDSIRNQTYENIEVILIDDGSSDSSPQLCRDYCKLDNRFKVIHQRNSGVSVARNQGLSVANGDYIMFVDADDYINTDICSVLLNKILESSAEIMICNKVFIINEKLCDNILYNQDYFIRTIDKDLFQLDLFTNHYDDKMNNVRYLSVGVTAKMFKREIIKKNSLKFDESCRFGEDVLFNLYAFEAASSIGYINFDGYNFFVSSDSSTHKFRSDWTFSHLRFMDGIDTFVEKNKRNDIRFIESAKMMKATRISSLAVSYYFHRDNPNSFFKNYKEFSNFIRKTKYAQSIKNVPIALLNRKQKAIITALRLKLSFFIALFCFLINRAEH
jgi:Glycosyltransferases involved in cell wall biogenesis